MVAELLSILWCTPTCTPWESMYTFAILPQFWSNWDETSTVWKFRNRARRWKKQQVNWWHSWWVIKHSWMYTLLRTGYIVYTSRLLYLYTIDISPWWESTHWELSNGGSLIEFGAVVGELLRDLWCTPGCTPWESMYTFTVLSQFWSNWDETSTD